MRHKAEPKLIPISLPNGNILHHVYLVRTRGIRLYKSDRFGGSWNNMKEVRKHAQEHWNSLPRITCTNIENRSLLKGVKFYKE